MAGILRYQKRGGRGGEEILQTRQRRSGGLNQDRKQKDPRNGWKETESKLLLFNFLYFQSLIDFIFMRNLAHP